MIEFCSQFDYTAVTAHIINFLIILRLTKEDAKEQNGEYIYNQSEHKICWMYFPICIFINIIWDFQMALADSFYRNIFEFVYINTEIL